MTVDYAPGPQSGGREPAPGRLALVQAFLNSFFDLDRESWGQDMFATPAGLEAWLRSRGLLDAQATVTPADHARALAVRDGLRTLIGGGAVTLEPAVAGVELDAAGRAVFVPASPDVLGALGLVLALVGEAQTAGTWARLKTCPGHGCGWAFYDHSRNQASTWCSVKVCGSREKARAYRRRSRRGGAP